MQQMEFAGIENRSLQLFMKLLPTLRLALLQLLETLHVLPENLPSLLDLFALTRYSDAPEYLQPHTIGLIVTLFETFLEIALVNC